MQVNVQQLEFIIVLAAMREYYEDRTSFMAEGSTFYFPLEPDVKIDFFLLNSLLYAANANFISISQIRPYEPDENESQQIDPSNLQLVIQVMYHDPKS